MKIPNLTLPETTPSTPIKVYCDASMKEETDLAAAGWLFTDHNGSALDTHGQHLGKGYNSVQAENAAIKRVLRALKSYNQAQHVKLYTDCKPVLMQLQNVNLEKGNFESVTLDWIPRTENQIADGLADLWIAQQRASDARQTEPYGICD
jgi:ribonuclease HI